MTSSFFDGRRLWLWILAGWLIVGLYALLRPHCCVPRPTDDLFYVDAAWKIQSGHYTAPTPDFPYHHYLRWSVILPLALVMKLFGASEAVLRLYPLIYMGGASLLFAAVARTLTQSTPAAFAAALVPLLLPWGMAGVRILSEGPALAWFAVGLAVVIFWGDRAPRRALIAAGACTALTISANQTAVFSAFLLPLFVLLREDGNWRRRAIQIAIAYGAGLFGTYALIILAEGIAFGDPLIEVHAVSWWHFKSIEGETATFWREFFNPASNEFALGFLVQILRSYPVFALLLLVLAALAGRGLRNHNLVTLFGCGLLAWLALEFLGPFVVRKMYLRFAILPVATVTFCLACAAAEAMPTFQSRWPAAAFAAALLFLAPMQTWENIKAAHNDVPTNYYREPFHMVVQHWTKTLPRAKSDDIVVVSDVPTLPGLIGMPWAHNAYTHYKLLDRFRQGAAADALSNPAPVRYFITQNGPGPELAGRGFVEIPPDPTVTDKHARVFVSVDSTRLSR